MTDQVTEQPTWLGVPVSKGARVGPLSLNESGGDLVGFWAVSIHGFHWEGGRTVVRWCKRDEVNARTLEWIRSLAALDPRTRRVDAVLSAAKAWRAADEDINTPPGGKPLDALADALDELEDE